MLTFTVEKTGAPTDYDLAPGFYEARVEDAVEKVAKSSGSPMIEATLGVMGPNGKAKVRVYLTFAPKSFWKVEQFLYATGDDLVPGQSVAVDATALVGRSLWVETSLRDGEKAGVQFPEVERYLRKGDAPYAGPKPEAARAAEDPRRTAMKSAPIPELDDDDIPF